MSKSSFQYMLKGNPHWSVLFKRFMFETLFSKANPYIHNFFISAGHALLRGDLYFNKICFLDAGPSVLQGISFQKLVDVPSEIMMV